MRSKSIRGAVLFLALTSFSASGYAQDTETSQQLRGSLDALDTWLGAGPNGEGWRKYLSVAELRGLLDAGAAADDLAVAAILEKFRAEAVPEKPQFEAVADDLAAWLAELQLPTPEELPAFVRASSGTYTSVDPEALKKAEGDLRFTLDRLDRFLARGQSGESWQKFLNLPAIQPVMTTGAAVELGLLEALSLRLNSSHPGLELPAFEEVRAALAAYLPLRRNADTPDAATDFDARLEALAALLEQYPAGYDPAVADAIAGHLGWMAERNQAEGVAAAVRRQYSRPNLHLAISERLIAAGIERPVDEPTTVEDVILGTNVRGSGQTVGRLQVELVPSDEYGIFDILLSGNTRTQTIGRNGPATIHSSGNTAFNTRKRIYLSARGIQTAPATARADTNTRTLGVSAGGGLADSIARGRVADSKARSEQISAEHAEERLKRQVDREAGAEFGEANRKFTEKFRRPLLERGAFPEIRFSTDGDYLRVVQLQATAGQLGAPLAAPAQPEGHDLSLRVHQSMLENLARSVLAGETLEQTEFESEINELFPGLIERIEAARAEAAPEDAAAAEEDPAEEEEEEEEDEEVAWEITFASPDPVTVRFGQDQVSITLRCTRFKTTRVRRVPMNITASYRIERGEEGVRLVRTEDLTILPPEFVPDAGVTLTPEQTVVRRQLQRRFGEIFQAEIVPEGLTLPDDWEQAGELTLVEATAQDGWLTAGWTLPPAALAESAGR